ncbi:hypothetical protein CAOG_009591 [Capsaspora owczarzaki ATCC 30864]|uniref:Uncharacterized protein n=1 Tax=Capsaspora owczarzaki (strain ATCC 30864) TaxID=595528 RepID=A0A0D2WM29_CAPO3|nr:hypothetical protein CAOG_009591 [Capsaspora owczarzaki ATCC 30864]
MYFSISLEDAAPPSANVCEALRPRMRDSGDRCEMGDMKACKCACVPMAAAGLPKFDAGDGCEVAACARFVIETDAYLGRCCRQTKERERERERSCECLFVLLRIGLKGGVVVGIVLNGCLFVCWLVVVAVDFKATERTHQKEMQTKIQIRNGLRGGLVPVVFAWETNHQHETTTTNRWG